MKYRIIFSFLFSIALSAQVFAQSCGLPDFVQKIYLELEDHTVKEGYYNDILPDWEQKKFTVEGKSYLVLDVKDIKAIEAKYKFDVSLLLLLFKIDSLILKLTFTTLHFSCQRDKSPWNQTSTS